MCVRERETETTAAHLAGFRMSLRTYLAVIDNKNDRNVSFCEETRMLTCTSAFVKLSFQKDLHEVLQDQTSELLIFVADFPSLYQFSTRKDLVL